MCEQEGQSSAKQLLSWVHVYWDITYCTHNTIFFLLGILPSCASFFTKFYTQVQS